MQRRRRFGAEIEGRNDPPQVQGTCLKERVTRAATSTTQHARSARRFHLSKFFRDQLTTRMERNIWNLPPSFRYCSRRLLPFYEINVFKYGDMSWFTCTPVPLFGLWLSRSQQPKKYCKCSHFLHSHNSCRQQQSR